MAPPCVTLKGVNLLYKTKWVDSAIGFLIYTGWISK